MKEEFLINIIDKDIRNKGINILPRENEDIVGCINIKMDTDIIITLKS